MSRIRSNRPVVSTAIALTALLGACATTSVASFVDPSEIPTLRQELDANPNQPEVRLRYAAALYTVGDCDAAIAEARLGMELAPSDALGPLVIGRCLEENDDPAGALAEYRAFLNARPDGRGSEAIRGRELVAARSVAEATARAAIENESGLGTPEPNVTGVLAWQVTGDPTLDALRLGLATLVSTDLAILQRFRMVERIQLDALMSELELGQGPYVDPETAPRVGRLIGAGRLVQGVLTGQRDGDATLSASILSSTGEVRNAQLETGRFQDLMRMQEDLVVEITRQMGFELSRAELSLIRGTGTQNLSAFLAFSDGLLAEERGNYPGAIERYGEAVRIDPGFNEARRRLQSAVAIDIGAGSLPVQITQFVDLVEQATAIQERLQFPGGDPLISSIVDIASLQGETATASGGGDGGKEIQQLNKPPSQTALTYPTIVRILVQLGGRQ